MKPNWSLNRKKEDLRIPPEELELSKEKQYRRDLTFLYQEAAFHAGVPLYTVLSIEDVEKEDDKKILTDILPEAKTAIIMGVPINDPWFRIWHLVPGVSMKKKNTISTQRTEIYLRQFLEKVEKQGYKGEIRLLPLTPDSDNKLIRIFELTKSAFIGKNHLLNTKVDGCRVSFGCLLTDAPLLGGDYRHEPYFENKCGDCKLCEEYCPAGALKNGEYNENLCKNYIEDENHQIQFTKYSWAKCDMCMRVCPLGETEKWDKEPIKWETLVEEKRLNS